MKTALAIVPAAVILLAGCASGSGAETPTSSGTGAVVDATTAPETSSSTHHHADADHLQRDGGRHPDGDPDDVHRRQPDHQRPGPQVLHHRQADRPVAAVAGGVPRVGPGVRAGRRGDDVDAVEGLHDPDPLAGLRDRHRQPVPQCAGRDRQRRREGRPAGRCCPTRSTRATPVTGWLIFKVDPRNAPKMVLDYTRPAVQVSGSRTSFPAKTFTVGARRLTPSP